MLQGARDDDEVKHEGEPHWAEDAIDRITE